MFTKRKFQFVLCGDETKEKKHIPPHSEFLITLQLPRLFIYWLKFVRCALK